MSKKILVINAGSSSMKFQLFDAETMKVLAQGLCERIFIDGYFKITYGNDEKYEENVGMKDHTQATEVLLKNLKKFNLVKDLEEIVGIGHRVVQGGTEFRDSSVINDKVIDALERYSSLAPLHNPPEITVIKIFQKLLPNAINLGAFDTAFHTTMPEINWRYALDRDMADKYQIRRYGMHGTSYKYITKKMKEVLKNEHPNLIICHLGNGASICAVKEGKSHNTSMGLTPLEGLIMGTRCGDIDPSIALYLQRQGMSIDEVDEQFNKKSGFKGLTGSADSRDVSEKAKQNDQKAIFAIKIYAKRVADYIVKYMNDLQDKIDAIVFTAGVGENAADMRQVICDYVFLKKLVLDESQNTKKYDDYKLISSKESDIPIYCVRTNEELMIALDVKANLK